MNLLQLERLDKLARLNYDNAKQAALWHVLYSNKTWTKASVLGFMRISERYNAKAGRVFQALFPRLARIGGFDDLCNRYPFEFRARRIEEERRRLNREKNAERRCKSEQPK